MVEGRGGGGRSSDNSTCRVGSLVGEKIIVLKGAGG